MPVQLTTIYDTLASKKPSGFKMGSIRPKKTITTEVAGAIQATEKSMNAQPKPEIVAKIPAETNGKLRTLSHDLSNSLETIMQASYLLAQMGLQDDVKRWTDLVDKAARDCARINREIREILRANI
jgi:K+-sensing histidine kinase KdpD